MSTPTLNVLILCGGKSSRMGTQKHLLRLRESEYLFQTLLRRCQQACPGSTNYFLSLHDRSCDLLSLVGASSLERVGLIFDSEVTEEDIGPAAGLLAAHRQNAQCYWLVIACDYALFSSAEIGHLLTQRDGELTCLQNPDGWPEPLLAIWSPVALRQLEENVDRGITGPKHVVRQLRAKLVQPLHPKSIHNVNTTQDWHTAMTLATLQPVVD